MKTILAVIGVIMLSCSLVSAHAMAEKAEPKVGSTVSKAPTQVRIWFSEEIEPAFSKIQVYGPDGKEVDKGDTHVDAKEKKLLIVSLNAQLGVGVYRVHWQVVSVDTHRTHDEFKFVVKP